MIERIISHMNDHHKDELIGLAKRFGGVQECSEVSLSSLDLLKDWIFYAMAKS